MCHVAPYPISIEWPPRWLAAGAARRPQASRAVRAALSHRRRTCSIGLGVERWDFTKGILERFHALEALLETNPHWRGRRHLAAGGGAHAQQAAGLPGAAARRPCAELERINARFATADWQPIVLIDEHQEPAQVFELYRAADFCLVNSLHDGMNLVAKEFVAARDDEDGVLMLSHVRRRLARAGRSAAGESVRRRGDGRGDRGLRSRCRARNGASACS